MAHSGAIRPLGVWWLLLTYIGVRLVQRRSYLVLLVPVVAVATWFGVMTFGEAVLGWTP